MRTRITWLAVIAIIVSTYAISWIPWLILGSTNRITDNIETLEQHDVAIIFGGLHNVGSELSETNRERLLAGATLIEQAKVSGLVISNTSEAASSMQDFLIEHGVPENRIELDTTAVVTEDTCVAEINHHPETRSVIFVSHGYHLPRIIFACERLGVSGIGVPAEQVAPVKRADVSPLKTLRIRFTRHQREAVLSLLNILGLYGPTLEKES